MGDVHPLSALPSWHHDPTGLTSEPRRAPTPVLSLPQTVSRPCGPRELSARVTPRGHVWLQTTGNVAGATEGPNISF